MSRNQDAGARLVMVRPDLDRLRAVRLPPGTSIRRYAAGDDMRWLRVQREADRYTAFDDGTFVREFGADPNRLARRQLYLCDAQGTVLGTATAWFNRAFRGQRFGRVHWVGIVPRAQGLGLGKPLLAAALQRLGALGHRRAYLVTAARRVPAINLYLQFGFQPAPENAEDLHHWQTLAPKCRYPLGAISDRARFGTPES